MLGEPPFEYRQRPDLEALRRRVQAAKRITPTQWSELEHQHRREINRVWAKRKPLPRTCLVPAEVDKETRPYSFCPAFHESRADVILMVRLDWEEMFLVEIIGRSDVGGPR